LHCTTRLPRFGLSFGPSAAGFTGMNLLGAPAWAGACVEVCLEIAETDTGTGIRGIAAGGL
jgi:hypothetical protein